VWSGWQRLDASRRCPACGSEGCLRRHGRYEKYNFLSRILIVRLRCRCCRRTHAIIPSFSLPGLSIGSAEAERYLAARAAGVGRGRAGAELVGRGMSEAYPKCLERLFSWAITRAKALLAAFGDERLGGLAWVRSVVGEAERPLVAVNGFCLAHRSNAVCFCRASILPCSRGARIRPASHEGGSAAEQTTAIASGP
jgi:hypothetical protein